MKTTIKHFVRAVVMMAIGVCAMVACEKDKPQQPQQQEPQQQEVTDDSLYIRRSYHCPLGWKNDAFFFTDKLWKFAYVINSQAEFDTIFPACSLPAEIDFNTQSLIVVFGGLGVSPNGFAHSCEMVNDTLKVTVTVYRGHSLFGEMWHYEFTVDKLNCGTIVDIEVVESSFDNTKANSSYPVWLCETDDYTILVNHPLHYQGIPPYPYNPHFGYSFLRMPDSEFDSVFSLFNPECSHCYFTCKRNQGSESANIIAIDTICGTAIDPPLLMQIERLDDTTQRWTNITPGADTNDLLVKEYLFKRFAGKTTNQSYPLPRVVKVKCEN